VVLARKRSAIYKSIAHASTDVTDYAIDDEHRIAPVVVGTTVVLIATFGLGLLYQLVGLVS